MAITPYLTGPYYFDLETRRVLGLALEMACITLGTGDSDDHVKHAIANNSSPWPRAESAIPRCCVTAHWKTYAGPQT